MAVIFRTRVLAPRALKPWGDFIDRTGNRHIFHRLGALWMAREADPRLEAHINTLRKLGAEVETLFNSELRKQYRQIEIDADVAAILEPNAGCLMARQAVQAVVAQFVKNGGVYRRAKIDTPKGSGKRLEISDGAGGKIRGDAFLFARGPWLETVLREILGEKIFPTRQVVFFRGPKPGDGRFAPPLMPAWGDAFSELPW